MKRTLSTLMRQLVVIGMAAALHMNALAQSAPSGNTLSNNPAAPLTNPIDDTPTNSLMARAMRAYQPDPTRGDSHALRDLSMFTVPPPRPREFALHDLVEIIVRETSNARSRQSLETDKEYEMKGAIKKFPSFNLVDLLELQLQQGSGTNRPELDLNFEKNFAGDGKYERRDDLTARVTAEVIEILPNGNLVLEARRRIQTDKEKSTIKVTGICRPEDVSATNTIISNQLHDLAVTLLNEGELKRASKKGIISRALDAIFAF
ncbi:MAG: flagellar basal body L-ring protein FlgH [Phycisphaerales bacterium]